MQKKTSASNKKIIEEAFKEFISEMTCRCPGTDIEAQLMSQLQTNKSISLRSSEVEFFKNLAMSSLGTPGEMAFDDVERGFLRAALNDGMSGLREYIESVPVETPLNSEGEKYRNNGKEKKQ